MQYLNAFLIGGLFCALGQIIIDKTKLSPARVVVSYVVAGVILTVLGLYEPIVNFAGAGATIPIIGFGYSLGKGMMRGISEHGAIGIFTGGVTATSAGITGAIFFGLVIALLFNPKPKK